jgi:arylsulfatase A-like enzyme
MDHCLGLLLDTLETTGLADRTAVILTGDHGTNVGERGVLGKGAPVREQEGHVPLFVRLPEGSPGHSDLLVQPQDFFPTILGLAGQKSSEALDGQDIMSVARTGHHDKRNIALAGPAVNNWKDKGEDGCPPILFTAFTKDWTLEVAAKPENSRLSKLGSLDYVEQKHPKVVQDIHTAALDEIERRGLDPKLVDWLRRGGEGALPEGCHFWDGWPGYPGFHPYFRDIYIGQ